MTRRQLLRSAGLGVAGLTLAGGLGELTSLALGSHAPGPPRTPRWHSRPDLRIPTLTVNRNRPGTSTDPIFIAPYNAPNGAQAGAVIVDNQGEPLWENPLEGKVTTNFRVQSYRGSPVLTWWEGSIELGHGVGEYVIADSSYRVLRRVQAARGLRGDLHEFVITSRDTALLTSYVVEKADLSSVGGSRNGTIQDAIFQEIDLASGRVLLEWHSLGHVSLAESYSPVGADWDFFHINSVDLDNDGNLLVSSRSTHTVYKLDPRGAILWRLGGKRSDFVMSPGSNFAWQHDVRRQPDGSLTVFDNGATPAVERRSRGLILDIDEQAMIATLLQQYTHPKILTGSQGSVQPLANGNVFIGWGESPHVSEFQHTGELLFDATLGREYQSYRAFRLPWTGMPADAPAVAMSGEGRERTVYASWNGATEVHAWQVLAATGEDDALKSLARNRSRSFETALRIRPHGAKRITAQALDAQGNPLGMSPEIAVTA